MEQKIDKIETQNEENEETTKIEYEQEVSHELFKIEDDRKGEETSVKLLCHGDLYVIGKFWIDTMKSVLVGAKIHKMSVIPVTYAAPPEETGPPKRPPKMKFEDLPLYGEASPHYDYKDYVADKIKTTCPAARVKLLHQYLFPKVKNYRKEWSESIADFMKDFCELKDDAMGVIRQKKAEFKCYMRSPDNMAIRGAVMALGTATGFYIGNKGGIPRKIFFTSAGVLSAGALCFPKETDEGFRTVSFQIAKLALSFVNKACGHNFKIRERLPCPDELPPPPPPRPLLCGEKPAK